VTISVFVGTSVDGFMARLNGDLDWLPADPEPHGYDEFIASVDAIVIGRKTYDTVLSFGEWPYGGRRVVVLSNHPLDFSAPRARGANVEQMAGEPAEIVSQLRESGVGHVYLDGGLTIQGFLRARLVDRLIITRIPVLLGEGVPLFGRVLSDIRLGHVQTRSFPSGLVQSEYRVAGPPGS
jgi:dihydrofolate reductase